MIKGVATQLRKKLKPLQVRQQKMREEEASRRKAEEARVAKLVFDAANWSKVQNINKFVDAVIVEATTQGSPILQLQVDNWVTWARNYAHSIDPITSIIQKMISSND